jgi:hypothetical protein
MTSVQNIVNPNMNATPNMNANLNMNVNSNMNVNPDMNVNNIINNIINNWITSIRTNPNCNNINNYDNDIINNLQYCTEQIICNNLVDILRTCLNSLDQLKKKLLCIENENNILKGQIETKQKELDEQLEYKVTENNQCNVCMTRQKNHAFICCGHMCVCETCAPKCYNRCPLCRTEGCVIKII